MYRQNAFVNTMLVYLLVFASGATRYNLADDKYTVIIFLIALTAWYLFTDHKVSEKFLLYLIVFVGLLFSLSLYTGGSLSVESVIKSTMKFMLAYLVLRTVGTNFVETYIKVVTFLAAISLFGFLIDILHLFEGLVTNLPRAGLYGFEGFLYTFRHIYHPDRNNSIFFEPGAYQGFLNAALFLIVFAKTDLSNRLKWIYISILFSALITAGSTTGFIIFVLLYVLFLYRSQLATFSQKMFSMGAIFFIATIFAAQFHNQLVVKINDYLNPSEERKGWSAENRSFDLQTDLKIFKKHVFGLGFDDYQKEFHRIGGFESGAKEGSSNGVTSTFAQYGLPYGVFIFISYFLALRMLLNDHLLATSAYVMYLLFLWGESYYQLAPISFAIIAAAFVFGRSSIAEPLQSQTESTQKG